MNKTEEYFWKNLSKHNLTSKNVIDRQKVDFDEIIKLMEQYAIEISRERAIGFHLTRTSRTGLIADKTTRIWTEIRKVFNNWLKEQEEKL